MEKRMTTARYGFIVLLLILGLVTRLLPHWPNFTALGAIALFGGAQLKPNWLAPLVTFGILLVSDFILGFYSGFGFIYIAFFLISIQGLFMKSKKASNVLAHSVLATLSFFLISNFGVWLSSGMYSKDISGLIMCYASALPYSLNFLAGTLVFGFALHYSIKWADSKLFTSLA
jgi:hypothetical protein